jgi:hypothetical protein
MLFFFKKTNIPGDYRLGNTVIVQKFELAYLTYYADEAKLPTFLVVVDLETKKAFWLFLQEYLLIDQAWRKQVVDTIHIPTRNDLSDIVTFEQEIDRAINYMRVVRGGTIRETVDHTVKLLEGKDPRFKVIPRITDTSEVYLFLARERVPITITYKGDNTTGEIKRTDLFDKGLPVPFGPGELEITGSAHFEEVAAKGVILRVGATFEATVTLVCRNEDGEEVERWNELPGICQGGRKEWRFESNLTNSPVKVTMGPMGNDVPGSINVAVDPIVWEGQRILNASYFDKAHKFLTTLVKNPRVTVECCHEGTVFFRVDVTMSQPDVYAPFISLIEVMEKARKVARHFKVNPVCTSVNLAGEEALKEIEIAFAILFEGGWEEGDPGRTFTSTVPKEEARKLAATLKEYEDILLLNNENESWEFMGEKVQMGPLAIRMTEAAPTLKGDNLQHYIEQSAGDVELSFESTEASKYTIRKQTSAEISAKRPEGAV